MLYSVLALKDVALKTPLMVAIVCAVVLIVAFIVGMIKGFRRVSWGGLFWLIAAAGFALVNRYLGKYLPVKDLLGKRYSETFASFGQSAAIMAGFIIVALIVYLILGACLRPHKKWVKKKDVDYDDYGLEYEMDDELEDEDDDGHRGMEMKKVGYGKPGVFARITGGLTCMINVGMILFVIVSIGLFLVDATRLSQGVLGAALEQRTAAFALKFAKAFTLDFIAIGVILGIGYAGYKNGFVATLRVLFVYVGGTALVIACFVLPFLKAATDKIYFLGAFVSRCSKVFASVSFGGILGKLLAGFLMAALSVVVLLLVHYGLGKLLSVVEDVKTVRVIDGVLSCGMYLLLGVLACVLVWMGLYVLEYCGIFHVSELINHNSSLSNGFYAVAEKYLKGFADKYLTRFM